jgi:hypothetical protein
VTAAATPVQTASSENSTLVDSSSLTLKGRDLFDGNIRLTGGDTASEAAALQAMQINGGGAGTANSQVNATTHFGPLPDFRGKLDPALAALAQRVRSGGKPTAEESRFAINGEAYVRLTLTNASADALEQLRKAGLTITSQQRNEIAGHIRIEKLEALARLPFLVWIAPR